MKMQINELNCLRFYTSLCKPVDTKEYDRRSEAVSNKL